MQIVAYFSLRTGLITISRGFMKGFDATTGIELANFAVNDNYKEVNDDIPKLGSLYFLGVYFAVSATYSVLCWSKTSLYLCITL